MSTSGGKLCPKCGKVAALGSARCDGCGHVYRTRFVNGPQVDPAEVLYIVMGTNGVESPPMPMRDILAHARQGYIKRHTQVCDTDRRQWMRADEIPALRSIIGQDAPAPPEPKPAPNPVPVPAPYPVMAPAAVAAPTPHAFNEYVRQYAWTHWMVLFGILGIFAALLGLALLVYAIVLKQSLRRKVAEMGCNPDILSAEAAALFWRQLKPLLFVAGAFIGVVTMIIMYALLVGPRAE